jgi:anti-repressor protein
MSPYARRITTPKAMNLAGILRMTGLFTANPTGSTMEMNHRSWMKTGGVCVNNNLLGLRVESNRVVVSSRDVARVFEKEHKHVLRDIRELGCTEDFNGSNFGLGEYRDAKGECRPEYFMTRDGFVLLVMGYAGDRAMWFKEAYIREFNRMERELREQEKISTPRTLKDALLLAARLEEEREALEADNKAMAPKAEFYDTVARSSTALDLGRVAKVLNFRGMGRNNLFAFLRAARILMGDNIPYQGYIDCGYFRIIEQRYQTRDGDTYISLKTLVRQPGVDFIRRKLIEAGYSPFDEPGKGEECDVQSCGRDCLKCL